MNELIELIRGNQTFLLKRTLHYAKINEYVKYTSTLESAWVVSISGLSESIVSAISVSKQVPEIKVDHNFRKDPISAFGVLEARKHRSRGITLEMFLGLMKYYRQSYLDLITDSIPYSEKQQEYLLWIIRFFDHNEIAFCSEWTKHSEEKLIKDLQASNRAITNEKTMYLAIFESMPFPVVLIDAENVISNMNYEAQNILRKHLFEPGHEYYNHSRRKLSIEEILPGIAEDLKKFNESSETDVTVEKEFILRSLGQKNLLIKFHRILDVSGKLEGTVIIFTDLTERKRIEDSLRYIGFHDMLTGLYNRVYMEQEIARLETGAYNPVGIISCDIDGLKLVNDNLGHGAGDMLMITAAKIIETCVADNGTAARIGGDEFVLILPSSDKTAVNLLCRKIRDSIREHNELNIKMPMSISIGSASGSATSGDDIRRLIKDADRLMYLDKQTNHDNYVYLFKSRFETFGTELFK